MVISMLFYYYDYLLIQYYRNIHSINDNEIVIKMKDYQFRISGEFLKVTYFSKEEMKIEGNIQNIHIIYD